MASNKDKAENPPTINPKKPRFISGCFEFRSFKKTNWISGCFEFGSFDAKQGASEQKKTKNPKKTSWVNSGCFGFGSFHRKRAVVDRSVEWAAAGSWRRKGVIRTPWCRKQNRTTTTTATVKTSAAKATEDQVAEEVSKGGRAVVVDQTRTVDNESEEIQVLIRDDVEEFNCGKDTNVTCQNQSSFNKYKTVNEDTTNSLKVKMDKPSVEEETKSKDQTSSTQPWTEQSRPRNSHKSNGDAMVAMSVLVVILVIMLLCGRLCAILCTLVWFYCMPHLMKTTKISNDAQEGSNSSVDPRIDRREVVFKGFLERKHKVFARIS